jgi:hypothetical protein
LNALVAIFCTLVLAAGWHYATNSSAVDRLAGVEVDRFNQLRRRLRRLNGIQLLALSAVIFWLFVELQRLDGAARSPVRFAIASGLTLVLLMVTLLLAGVDMWLTSRMRASRRRPPQS